MSATEVSEPGPEFYLYWHPSCENVSHIIKKKNLCHICFYREINKIIQQYPYDATTNETRRRKGKRERNERG